MEEVTSARKPLIFEYEDYRLFLRDMYVHLKSSARHFSFRYFSKRAGFASPNFLKLVIEGKRNISDESIPRFIGALKLTRAEGEFFANLVHFNQARDSQDRAACAREILKSKVYQKIHPIQQAEFAYYANWYYIPVRELVALAEFREDPHWICHRVFPAIAADEAKAALHDLEALGLLVRTPEGRLLQAQKTVSTENEVVSSTVAAYHREMMLKAAESIDAVPRQRREISAACVPISKETAEKIKTMMQEFRQEVLAIASADEAPETIYQLNLQLFPMSRWDDEGEVGK